MKTLNIIKKNFQRTLNMKASSLILILGPLILIGVIGIALHDTSIKNIQAGIYSIDADPIFHETILKKLKDNSITPREYNFLSDCKQDVKNGDLQLCIEIKPPETNNFNQQNQNIILHVDFSKQRTVWNIIGRIQGIIDTETTLKRNEMINNLKSETKSIQEITKKNGATIDNALKQLDLVEYHLQIIESKKNSINNQIDSSILRIDDEISELGKIIKTLQLLEIPVDGINKVRNDLMNIRHSLSQTKNEFPSTEVDQIKIEILTARKQLTKAKQDLEIISADIQNVNNNDFNKLINPIQLTYKSVLNKQSKGIQKNLGFLDYLFPSFLIFFILFNSIIFSASTRLKERKSSAYLRNMVSGVKQKAFIWGDFITSIILISIQIMGMLFLFSFFLNLSIMDNIIPISQLVIISVAIFTLIGLTIGSIFSSQETVIITSISISLLFFIFSSLITPIETLPSGIATIVKIMPLTLLEAKLRLTTIFNLPLWFNTKEIFGLLITVLGSIFIINIFTRKNKRKLI